MLNQKGLAHIFLILVLLLGIVATVFLAGKTQIFKPKATVGNIEIGTNECIKTVEEKKTLVCESVPLKLISPIDSGNASTSDAGFSLVKTVYAADPARYCKPSIDPNKIYHKEKICNPILGIICLTWLSSREVEIGEDCRLDQVCEETSTDLFKSVAKCVPQTVQPGRNFQPSFVQSSSDFLPSPQTQEPQNTQAPLPVYNFTPDNTVVPSATSAPSSAEDTSAQTTSSSSEQNTQNLPTPTPTLAPSPSSSVSPTSSSSASAKPRVTLGYRVAETKDGLNTADWHDDYKAGGVNYIHHLQDKKPGSKFFFVQFRDQDKQVIKFDSGNDYAVSAKIIFGTASSSTPSPASSSTAKPTLAPALSCKVKEPNRNCTLPTVEKCEIKTLADVGNCSNAQLLATLTKDQLGTLPLEIIKKFGTNDLMCFFPRNVVARLDAGTLEDLPNEDLLLLGDSTGNCSSFLKSFSCDRIVQLPLEYQALTNCGH